jgi:hypothetical protein
MRERGDETHCAGPSRISKCTQTNSFFLRGAGAHTTEKLLWTVARLSDWHFVISVSGMSGSRCSNWIQRRSGRTCGRTKLFSTVYFRPPKIMWQDKIIFNGLF